MKGLLTIFALFTISFASASDYCSGWSDGYQDALDECLRVAATPVCPVEPVNSSGYSTGYGRGYASARAAHCN